MTRNLLAILSLLPLAVLVGCGGDPDGNACSSASADCGDDNVTTDQFAATLRSVAPYGWVGDHRVSVDDEDIGQCEDINSCDASLVEYGNFELHISGDTFACVPQMQLVTINDDGTTVSVSDVWSGEGICGLTPDGNYSGLNVRTGVESFINGYDQMTISLESWAAVVTGKSFLYDGEYDLEGTVSDDLSSIEYFLIAENGNESTGLINLE